MLLRLGDTLATVGEEQGSNERGLRQGWTARNLNMIDAIGEIGSYPFKAVFNSFRYIFSSEFRGRTHTRWRDKNLLYILGEVVFCFAFTLATLVLLVYLVMGLWTQLEIVTIRSKYRLLVATWFLVGIPLGICTVAVSGYFFIPLMLLFFGVAFYQLSFECPRCGEPLWYRWFLYLIPKNCRNCGNKID